MVRISCSATSNNNTITMKATTLDNNAVHGVSGLQTTEEGHQEPFASSLSWSCSSSSLDQGGEGNEKRLLGTVKDSAMTRAIFRTPIRHETREDAGDHCTPGGLEESISRREVSSLSPSNVEVIEDIIDTRDNIDNEGFALASPPRFRRSASESPKRVVGNYICPPQKKSCRSWIKMANPIRQQSSLDMSYSSHVTPEFDTLSIFRSYSSKPVKGKLAVPNKSLAREKRQEREDLNNVQPSPYDVCDIDRHCPYDESRPEYHEEYARDDGSIGPDSLSPSPSVEEVKMATPVRSSSVTFLTAEMSTGTLPLFPFLPTDKVGVTMSTSVKCGDQLLEWNDAVPEESFDFSAAAKNISYFQPPETRTALSE